MRINNRGLMARKTVDDPLPTRSTLLSRLRNCQDDQSWQEFFNLYWQLIYDVALKYGLSDAEAQDVVQETMLAVHRKIPEFRYDPTKGSFKNWLFNLTRWRVLDHLRRRPSAVGMDFNPESANRATPVVERIPDESQMQMERFWDREWAENLQKAALERIKQKVEPKQFQVFDLYVLREWPAGRVSKTLNVSLTQVYLAKHRIAKLLRQELKLMEQASVTEAGTAS